MNNRLKLLAVRTQPGEFELVAQDLEICFGLKAVFYIEVNMSRSVHQTVATDTADMIMQMGNPVKPLQIAAQFHPLDFARRGNFFTSGRDSHTKPSATASARHWVIRSTSSSCYRTRARTPCDSRIIIH